jgi:hypothetical protein
MTTKPPQTIAALAKNVLRETQAVAASLTETKNRTQDAHTEAQAVAIRAEAAWAEACRACTKNDRREDAAEALIRLADHPEIIDVLLSGSPSSDHLLNATMARRGLLSVHKDVIRGRRYFMTELGRDASDLARELRDRLAAPE